MKIAKSVQTVVLQIGNQKNEKKVYRWWFWRLVNLVHKPCPGRNEYEGCVLLGLGSHTAIPAPMPAPSCGKKGDGRSATEQKRRRVELLTEALARRTRLADTLAACAPDRADPAYHDKKWQTTRQIDLNAAVMMIERALLQQTLDELTEASVQACCREV